MQTLKDNFVWDDEGVQFEGSEPLEPGTCELGKGDFYFDKIREYLGTPRLKAIVIPQDPDYWNYTLEPGYED